MAKTINIGIAGLGTVGAETYRIIKEENDFLKARSGVDFNIAAVSAKSKDKQRNIDLSGVKWVEDCRDIANINDIDVVVELVGGSEGAARELVEKSIIIVNDLVVSIMTPAETREKLKLKNYK